MNKKVNLANKEVNSNNNSHTEPNSNQPSFKITNSNNYAKNRLELYKHMQNFSAYVNKIKQEISKETS